MHVRTHARTRVNHPPKHPPTPHLEAAPHDGGVGEDGHRAVPRLLQGPLQELQLLLIHVHLRLGDRGRTAGCNWNGRVWCWNRRVRGRVVGQGGCWEGMGRVQGRMVVGLAWRR